MNYQKFYFYLDSAYQFGEGWPDEASANAFHEEVAALFRIAGWQIQRGKFSGACDTAVRQEESLYLHPMEVSGIIRKDSVPEIRSILSEANCFRVREVRGFEEYAEMSDDAYRKHLESRRGEMEQAILKHFVTRRRNLFQTGDPSEQIARPFFIHRLESRDSFGEDMSTTFVRKLIEEIIADGRLETAQTKYGRGIRTAGKIKPRRDRAR